jgi:hypothetical protein
MAALASHPPEHAEHLPLPQALSELLDQLVLPVPEQLSALPTDMARKPSRSLSQWSAVLLLD